MPSSFVATLQQRHFSKAQGPYQEIRPPQNKTPAIPPEKPCILQGAARQREIRLDELLSWQM